MASGQLLSWTLQKLTSISFSSSLLSGVSLCNYRPLVLIQTALWLFWEERTLISFNFTYFPCLLITERCNPQAFYVILARESPHEKRCFKLNRYTVSSPLNFIKHRHCSILSPGVQHPERRELIVRTGRIQCRTSIWLWLSLMSAI